MDQLDEKIKKSAAIEEQERKEFINELLEKGGYQDASLEEKIEFLKNKRDEYEAQFTEEEWNGWGEFKGHARSMNSYNTRLNGIIFDWEKELRERK